MELQAALRESTGKRNKAAREKGHMPAVLYGRKEKTTPLMLSRAEFLKIWKKAGESSVVRIVGLQEPKDVLIHDVDFDPVTGVPRHADFYVFEKGQKVKVKIPLEFEGIAPAVKDLGGTLVKVIHELEVEAEPGKLPHSITVDISPLSTLEAQIYVKDIKLPTGVAALADGEDVVALAAAYKEEKEEVPLDISAIEVEKKGKEEEAGAEVSPEEKGPEDA